MRIDNSEDYTSAPLEITVQDLAIIFDQLNLGLRRQMQIVNDIWENNRWILPAKYRAKNKKKKYIEDVLYQIDYLYHKDEIDSSLIMIKRNAKELGYRVNEKNLSENYSEISEYFKTLWIQLKFISLTDCSRARIKTILDKYHYKKRTEKFCDYFEKCLYFYKIEPTIKGNPCDIRSVSINQMITFRLKKRRSKKPT